MLKMRLELFQEIDGNRISVQEGLSKLANRTFSMNQNLVTRVKTPVLEDGTDLWKDIWLDSKTMNL